MTATGIPRIPPTAPGRLPLVGHVPKLAYQRDRMLQSLRSVDDIVLIYIGALPVYVVTCPQLLHEVLATNATSFEKGLMFDRSRPLVGEGLITSEREFHQRQRRVMAPSFRNQRLEDYTSSIRTDVEARIATWRDNQHIAMDDVLQRMAAGAAYRVLFGCELDDDTIEEIDDCVSGCLKEIAMVTMTPPLLEKLPNPLTRALRRQGARLSEIVESIIKAHQANPPNTPNLLSSLLAATESGSTTSMTRRQLHDEVKTMLVGSTHTTSSTLAWTFYELGRRPEIQAKLQQEVDTVLRGRPFSFEDMEKLVYTQHLVDETLRLHSVTWLLMRRAVKPVWLGDVLLPTGAEIIFSPLAIHRDPSNYPNPLDFDPDRWRTPPPKAAFLPFSGGTRKCIGSHMARHQMILTVATIAARWQVRPVPGKRIRAVPSVALRPNRLPMIVEARSNTV